MIGEPIQRAIVHNEDDIPDDEMIYYHADLLLENYGIDVYECCHKHDDSGFCIVALFTMNDESCCVQVSPCVFPKPE